MLEQTQEELDLLASLQYDPITGIFIWTNPYKRICFLKGREAGSFSTATGYYHIALKGKHYKSHRLAFLFVDGKLPERSIQIDHINGIEFIHRRCRNLLSIFYSYAKMSSVG